MIDKILDNLYLTDLKGARSISQVIELKINIIVSIIDIDPLLYLCDAYSDIECVYLYAQDDDIFDIEQYFQKFKEIMLKNKTVLVHCHCGVSRSSTLIASYMIYQNIKTKRGQVLRILKMIKNKRACISPVDGFIIQLNNYRNKLLIEFNLDIKKLNS